MAIGTTIDGLNAVTSLTTNDEVPVWDKEASGEPTKKITASNLASSVKSLASLPNTTEMNAAIAQSTAKISSGLYVPTESVPANMFKDYWIAFGKTYNAPPTVVANCRQSFTPVSEMTGPNIVSIGINGFTVRYKSSYSAALTPETTWIAIGN